MMVSRIVKDTVASLFVDKAHGDRVTSRNVDVGHVLRCSPAALIQGTYKVQEEEKEWLCPSMENIS